jgi:N6-L-threonylcarbamoyladenine synthase
MIILSVESTCDETAVAVTRNGREVLSDIISSQADMHALYGGVVPEIASRSHVEVISRLADEAVAKAGITRRDIGAVAVSYAPASSAPCWWGSISLRARPWPWGCP